MQLRYMILTVDSTKWDKIQTALVFSQIRVAISNFGDMFINLLHMKAANRSWLTAIVRRQGYFWKNDHVV